MIKKTILSTVATSVLLAAIPLTGEIAEKTQVSMAQVEAATAEKVIYKAKVTSKTLTVRSTKSIKSKKLGTLKKGNTVSVTVKSGSYSKIKYSKGYGWVTSKSISQLKNATLIKGAPKKRKRTKLPYTDSAIRAMDVEQASLITQTATWDVKTKPNQLKAVAKSTGLDYGQTPHRINLDFVDIGKKEGDINFDLAGMELFFSGKEISINITDQRRILLKESEYVLTTILRPYFPKSYKKIAHMFYADHYVHGGNRFAKPKKYDGLNLYIVGGKIRFWK